MVNKWINGYTMIETFLFFFLIAVFSDYTRRYHIAYERRKNFQQTKQKSKNRNEDDT